MASTAYPEASANQLTVILPVTLKPGRNSPETEVANALKPGNTIKRICLVAMADKRGKRRSLRNCDLVAKWLEQHGSQLEELLLTLDETEEAELILSLFKCAELRLNKLLVSAADFPSYFLQKLPATLEVFSGHLGSHGDLAPFVALPKLQSLGVRCYPSKRYDDRWTTADVPMALLHHPTLQCLVVDVASTVEITEQEGST